MIAYNEKTGIAGHEQYPFESLPGWIRADINLTDSHDIRMAKFTEQWNGS